MGLDSDDRLPEGISFRDAYSAVRTWYQSNLEQLKADERSESHAKAASAYIESLAPPAEASEVEMKDCLRRVLCRDLEFGYHESDGAYKMAAYAHAAFKTADEDPFAA